MVVSDTSSKCIMLILDCSIIDTTVVYDTWYSILSVGSTPSLIFSWREGQERDTLDKERIIWNILGTFTVQLRGRVGHTPDTMLISLLGGGLLLSSSTPVCIMYVHPHSQGEAPYIDVGRGDISVGGEELSCELVV